MERIPLEDVQRALKAFEDASESVRGPVAQSVARRRAGRLARLAAVLAEVEDEAGSEDPAVEALKLRIEKVDSTRIVLEKRSERERRRVKLKPHEWMVYGRVLNHDRTPATGVRIQVFDQDKKLDDVLAVTKVDEFGDFAAGPFHERDFFEPGEEAPELYLKVYGSRNKVLYDGSKDVRLQAGRSEYFEITLPKSGPSSTTRKAKKG